MRIILSLDDGLMGKVRKIAVEGAAAGLKRRERAALQRSFERLRFKVGKLSLATGGPICPP